MDELKACPFCGEQHEWEDITDMHFGPAKALICGHRIVLIVYPDQDESKRIAFWNTRPIEDALQAELERANQRIKELVSELDLADKVIANLAPDDFDETATCLVCGNDMQIVRPGKYQCNYCESEE